MIQIKNLVKTYDEKEKQGFFKTRNIKVQAVKGIDLTIPKGKITGLLGINGAGKTTTVKMLSTLIKPTSGEMTFNGMNYKKNEKKIKFKINMIAGGERMIYWRLTAKENLMYFGQMYGLNGNQLKNRVNYLLNKVGLMEKTNIPVEKFSKGMKQRLQIARGLINDPEYIFLDEPTLGLDVQIAKEMRNLFKQLTVEENKGILLTTHYMQEVEELCDYIYILNQGLVIKEGLPSQIAQLNSTGDNISLESAIIAISDQLSGVNACIS